jgi:hypothetical protein
MICAATLSWINHTSLKFRGRDYLSFTLKFASFVKLDTKNLSNQTLRQQKSRLLYNNCNNNKVYSIECANYRSIFLV